jgi:hypothetical protein
VKRGEILRLFDLEGQQAVDFLCFDAADPTDRYSAANTIKVQGNIYIGNGTVLYSDRGAALFTIAADTCGGHDTIYGCCSEANNFLRYGVRDRQIEDGRGFVVIRRLPVEYYSKDEIGMIYWGIGTHLGRGLSQSVLGDRLGHVKDFSREDPLARAYRNKQELSPHTDSADLVGLACLRNAQTGGVSGLTSATTVHNVMLEEYPEALERDLRYFTSARQPIAGTHDRRHDRARFQ